jgi:pimeloyl-ACP methyl ester carboxylesterase
LNASPAILVGVSLGGAIAAKVAVEESDRVSKLVLVASPGIMPLGPEMSERLKRLVTFRTREGAIERLRRTFLSPMLVTEDLVDSEFQASVMPGAQECLGKLGAYLTDGLDADVLGERFGALAAKHPTLILWGSEDKILPPSVGAEMARIADGAARLVVVEECGHALPMERPGVFNRLLVDFLAGSPASAHGSSSVS